MSFTSLVASHRRIKASRTLIHAARQAEDRSHALGLQYADWWLRLDLAVELRQLSEPPE